MGYFYDTARADDLYELEQTLKNYLPILTAKKKLLTNYCLEKLLEQLHSLSYSVQEAREIVDNSIVKGYDKFYTLPKKRESSYE
jgi:hypothetical protein